MYFLFLGMLAAFGFTESLWAQTFEPVPVFVQQPNVDDLSDDDQTLIRKKIWPALCKGLGETLTVGKNPTGMGFFKSFTCGKGAKSDGQSWWIETIITEDDGLTVKIKHRWRTGQEGAVEASMVIPWHRKLPTALKEKSVIALMGASLLDQLPADRYMQLGTDGTLVAPGNKRPPKGSDKSGEDATYFVFALRRDEGRQLWAPMVVGRLTRKSGDEVWKLDNSTGLNAPGGYWLKDTRGRGGQKARYDEELGKVLVKKGVKTSFLESLALETFKGGYTGIRWGKAFANNDPFLANSSIVGLLVEIRGGPLKGLRWYLDYSPQTRAVLDGEKYHFKWSRNALAWSFGMDLNIPVLKRIDVVPKYGLMDFDARLPVQQADGTYKGVVFNLKGASSFGGEIGAESIYPWFLLRLWTAIDLSQYVKISNKGSVKSVRFGADTYWDLVDLSKKFKLALLLFAASENMTVTQGQDRIDNADPNEAQVLGIEYQFGYAGAGITLRW